MIENTKKILRKLIDNVSEYQVQCFYYKYSINVFPEFNNSKNPTVEYNIQFKIGEQYYGLYISDLIIRWDMAQIGSQLKTELDEQFRYEILDLCVRLNNRCEDYTSTMFRKFADESNNESDDDLE